MLGAQFNKMYHFKLSASAIQYATPYNYNSDSVDCCLFIPLIRENIRNFAHCLHMCAVASDSAPSTTDRKKSERFLGAGLQVIIMICNDLSFELLRFGDDDLLLNVRNNFFSSSNRRNCNCFSTSVICSRARHNSCNDFQLVKL